MEIARLIGSAGSGKTTALLDIMEKALGKLGNDPRRLGFASFTRAARAEAVSRAAAAWGVSESLLAGEGWFRTVHSTCFRVLGVSRGQMIGGTKADEEWVSNAVGERMQVEIDEDTGQTRFVGNPLVERALACWDLSRAKLLPMAEVHRRACQMNGDMPGLPEVVRMIEHYETAKRIDDRLDYVDLLARFAGFRFSAKDAPETCSPEGALPEVSAWLFDEQQDASPLLDAACKRLVSSPTVQWCYVVGDAFQAIHGFAGSNADCFLAWPAKKERIMDRSYRCPQAVLDLGERCLRRMHRGYFDRGVQAYGRDGTPRPKGDGSVHEVPGIEDVVSRINPSESWLLIARTKYQAKRFAAAMHEARKPVRWTSAPDGPTIRSTGLAALLKLERGEPITGADWAKALQLLPTKNSRKEDVLSRGTKTRWKDEAEAKRWDVIFPEELPQVGGCPALVNAVKSGEWVGLVDRGSEWRSMAERYGEQLASEPRVRVGTIHSVKGAEADNVAVLTTTSQRVQNGAEDQEQHDEECRIAYVAVTRARHNLYVVNEGGPRNPRMELF